MSSALSIIILAAGKGTRMKSMMPKVLHKIANREMINLVIDTAKKLDPQEIIIVVSEDMAEFTGNLSKEHQNAKLNFAFQKERRGTADAVKIAMEKIQNKSEKILILYGDTPLLKAETLQKMIAALDNKNQTVCVLGFECLSENKYGRLIVDGKKLQRIVEFKDFSDNEKNITLCNSGVVVASGAKLPTLLHKVDNKNNSGEYYLTDIIKIAVAEQLNCTFIKADEAEVMGINSRTELAQAEQIKQNELRRYFMENGVTLTDPASVYFSYDTKIANDVIIHPQVVIYPGVEIATNVEIKSFSQLEGVKIACQVTIGPFARIRPDTVIEQGAKIGNFVEIKKSLIKSEAKISHLSYIGDSEIGESSNIGAGTITCNYDGYKKFKTKIGKRVFVGSNTAFIAPVVVGDDAVIGAGSVITKEVGAEELAVSRAKQNNLPEGGKKYHQSRK